MAPLAPALLSTTTVWPEPSPSALAMMRAALSAPPPAENGTTTVMACAAG